MGGRRRLVTGGLITVTLAATLMTCSGAGDLAINNRSPTGVTVLTGDEELTISAGGAEPPFSTTAARQVMSRSSSPPARWW